MQIKAKLLGFLGTFKGEVQKWERGRSNIKIQLRFQIKTTIKNDALYCSFNVFKVYLCKIDSETAEI